MLNIGFTAVYNLAGLSLAALGFLPPIFAAAAQSLPDLGILKPILPASSASGEVEVRPADQADVLGVDRFRVRAGRGGRVLIGLEGCLSSARRSTRAIVSSAHRTRKRKCRTP